MRYVDRSKADEPEALSRKFPDDKTELQRATAFYNKPRKLKKNGRYETFDFTRYKDQSVKQALDKLFHGKCAYCESQFSHVHPVDVEHYRPKGMVEDDPSHPGYWWLAMDWHNLLPSCIDCNRRRDQKVPRPSADGSASLTASGEFDRSKTMLAGKEALFPLIDGSPRASKPDEDLAGEKRLLLDPTRDEPRDHLRFYVDRSNVVGLAYAAPISNTSRAVIPDADIDPRGLVRKALAANVSPQGVVSIQVYGLNRLSLVQQRTKVLHDMEFLYQLSIDLNEIVEELGARIARNEVTVGALVGPFRVQYEADIEADKRITAKLRQYVESIHSRLEEMTKPSAPYSELARAWVKEIKRAWDAGMAV